MAEGGHGDGNAIAASHATTNGANGVNGVNGVGAGRVGKDPTHATPMKVANGVNGPGQSDPETPQRVGGLPVPKPMTPATPFTPPPKKKTSAQAVVVPATPQPQPTPFGALDHTKKLPLVERGSVFELFEEVKGDWERGSGLEEKDSGSGNNGSTLISMRLDVAEGKLYWKVGDRMEVMLVKEISGLGQGQGTPTLQWKASFVRGSLCMFITFKNGTALNLAATDVDTVLTWCRVLDHMVRNSGKVANVALMRLPVPAIDEPDELRKPLKPKVIEKIAINVKMMRALIVGLRVILRGVWDLDKQCTKRDSELIKDPAFYTATRTLTFPSEGSSTTPPHRLKTFQFKDYAAHVFLKIRQSVGIPELEFLRSVAGRDYHDFVTNSKSGGFFFFTHDKQYMIKSHAKAESKFFRSILPRYHQYLVDNPSSLLSRIVGLHRVRNPDFGTVHFIVMRNIFRCADTIIHERFDLKGSVHGRNAKEKEKEQKFPVFKDNDFLKMNKKLRLEPSIRKQVMTQLDKDTQLLCDLKIMDYSLLVGIGDRRVGGDMMPATPITTPMTPATPSTALPPTPHSDKHSKVLEFPSPSSPLNKSPQTHYGLKKREIFSTAKTLRNLKIFSHMMEEELPDKEDDEKAAPVSPAVKRLTSRFSMDDGIMSVDGNEQYYFGVIDILQDFNARKQAEWLVKFGRAEISCQPPGRYRQRFMAFFDKCIVAETKQLEGEAIEAKE